MGVMGGKKVAYLIKGKKAFSNVVMLVVIVIFFKQQSFSIVFYKITVVLYTMGTICSITNEQHPDSRLCQLQKTSFIALSHFHLSRAG